MPDPIPSLADARRLVEGATDGPWAVTGADDPLLTPWTVTTADVPGERYVICHGAMVDAAFIAASRTLVPALLAAVEGVLALDGPFTGENSAQDYMRAVRGVITVHVRIEEEA